MMGIASRSTIRTLCPHGDERPRYQTGTSGGIRSGRPGLSQDRGSIAYAGTSRPMMTGRERVGGPEVCLLSSCRDLNPATASAKET
jgi:hypothetical protein